MFWQGLANFLKPDSVRLLEANNLRIVFYGLTVAAQHWVCRYSITLRPLAMSAKIVLSK